jgi:hypothetical protein
MNFELLKDLGEKYMSLQGGPNPATPTTEGEPGVVGEINSKTLQYFMTMWPLLMSFGMGGSIIGAVYAIIAFIQKKIMERWVCTVDLNYNDATYHWVKKYIKDEKLIAETGDLKCFKKPPDDRHESFINRSNDKKKPEVDFDNGTGEYFITFKGRTIWVKHSEGKTQILGWGRRPTKP